MRQKNNPEMLRIYIDDAYAFSMPEEEYFRLNLYERAELTREEADSIREEVNIKAAKQKGISMLAARDRSEHEVKERLLQQGFDADAAEGAVMQLKAMGYINDNLFAHKFISDRLKLKPMSKKALTYELQRKGIESDLIDAVMSEFELDESSTAYRIVKKKFGKYNIEDPGVQRKVYSFLSFRGFSYETIQAVLEQMRE
jgi:regulatory protein